MALGLKSKNQFSRARLFPCNFKNLTRDSQGLELRGGSREQETLWTVGHVCPLGTSWLGAPRLAVGLLSRILCEWPEGGRAAQLWPQSSL